MTLVFRDDINVDVGESYLPSDVDVVGILGSPEVGRTILGHHLDEEEASEVKEFFSLM